jgi:uncharacterized protein (UPF0212 family)
MRPVTTSELLKVWEEGHRRLPYEKALLLLEAACPEKSSDKLAALSIGSRDARLLTLREWTFGHILIGVTACPACGERLEIKVNVNDVRTTVSEARRDEFNLELDEYHVIFRLPSTVDLREANKSGNMQNIRTALIRRCFIKASRNDEEVATDQLPVSVIDAVIERMAGCDPQANTHFVLDCPDCSHRWNALFDIVSFFWSEIHAWALRVLQEVHILASAYGWREAEILAMSPVRRQSYLRMLGI